MGGKICLPPSVLQTIAHMTNVEFPLVFEISRASRTKTSHVGVFNFESQPGTAIIPKWIMKNLDLYPGDFVKVRLVTLPKGSYIKLKPHQTAEFFALNQPKEILETVLRSFNTVTQGDVLEITYENTKFVFDVLETKPALAIDINNVDVAVDFFEEVNNTSHNVTWKAEEASPPAATLANGASPGPSASAAAPAAVTKTGHADATHIDTTKCENCLKMIPTASLTNHIVFCKRNNMVCPGCKAVILISQRDQHNQEIHAQVPCVCGLQVEKWQLEDHKAKTCLHRLERCRFCGLQKKFIDLPPHEQYCGTRTEQCTSCNRFIMIKNLEEHVISNCTFPPAPPKPPTPEPTTMAKMLNFFIGAPPR